MNKFLWLGAVLAAAVSLHGEIAVGDSYQKVIEEKGPPAGKMQAGTAVVLRYSDVTIRLKDDKVVSVDDGFHSGGATRTGAPAPAPAAYASGSWTTDYRAALSAAKDQNRHVFLLFTGSDWCPWCKKLQAEILGTADFKAFAEQNLVLVELDFPNDKPQSSSLKKQNQALLRTYRVPGYPTVVVLDATGHEVGRLGYQEGGPKAFIQQLRSL